jgi:hypothetical protein
MRFESRELAYQVYFAEGDDKKPCQGVSCGQNTCGHTKEGEGCGGCSTTKLDEGTDCNVCSTTKCDTNTCNPKALSETASRNDLSLLRARLQDALSV